MKKGMVQIVIKAPNQMVNDQRIDCDRLWNINQLKEHLFKEYPSHPKPEHQKLIYSGKLLSDEMLLTDVLKTYGGHEYNTIHLVCSVRENSRNKIPSPLKFNGAVFTDNYTTQQPMPTRQAVAGSTSIYATSVLVNRRYMNDCNFRRSMTGSGVQYIYSQDIVQQMLFIQQAYIQYMTNHINMANNGQYALETQPNDYYQERTNREVPQNEVEAEPEDDVGVQRDWLEWIYIMIRLIVLFSVVYFYSSPLRFIVVMTMALLLFNMDVERWRRRQDEAPDVAQVRNGGGATRWQPPEREIQEGNQAHPLHVISTFITSFFLSLIPEQRAF